MEIIKVEDLVRNYRKSILKENENDVKVLKKLALMYIKVNLWGLWENQVMENYITQNFGND